jgi:hypothetical protein
MRYQGEYICPTCGLGSGDLKPEYRAWIKSRLGDSWKLRCDICGRNFLVVEKRQGASQ